MIGVKRPFKLGAPKPPKSAKKKKLLKTTKPIPDPDNATVMAIPRAESMVQKPMTEVVEESVNCTPLDFEPCNKLPHKMRYRYRMLLKQSNPQTDGDNPSLAYLEDKYGHWVKKEFWYNRVVKLASTYRENGQGEKEICDNSHSALEPVGHLVPLTTEEQERLHAESMVNKPDCEFGPPFDGLYDEDSQLPVTDVLEEGEIPSAQEMVKNLKYVQGKVLEFPDKLPHLMGFRYKLLLEKCSPKELIEGQPPSFTWLEERYGHLVEKEFWYDRTVQLASTYLETCEGDVFDKTQFDLEQAVGHVVPFTELEKEYLQLLENYKKSRPQIDGIPTLEYLRTHHSKPPTVRDSARVEQAEQIPASPEYLPSLSEEEAEAEATLGGCRYVPKAHCPIREESKMTCLNADEVYGALLFKCTKPGCSVFYTSATSEDVCYQLREAIHPTVHQGLIHADLKCHCDYTPRMKLSQSQKNPGRVFLTCFKKHNPCNYFQWVHWKVRPPQGPMDAFVQPRADFYVQKPGRYTRPVSHFPSEDEIHAVLAKKRKMYPETVDSAWGSIGKPPRGPNQQLVATGLDRFKKDDVKMYPETSQPRGFVPSSGPFNSVGHEFRNGLYVGDNSFEHEFFGPSSSLF